MQLVFLTAGVTTGQQGGNIEGTGAFVQRGTGSFNANGQRGQNNNFMVDGIDNNESWINTTVLQPSVEATREFKVYTANAPAEFGRSSGGIVNVQTRSGSNDLHGSAFEYLRNAALDARNFFQRKTPQDQRRLPNFVQSQFGATIGGPIKRNNWFFFGDYQGFRQALGLDITSTVPTVAQKQGNFGTTNIYDPLTTRTDPANPANYIRDQFPNNTIPASRIPRPAGILANFYPDPNVAGLVNNFFFSPSKYQTDDAFNIRSDKILSQNNTLFTRVSRGRDVTSLPGALPPPANSSINVGPYAGADASQSADSADFNLVTWGGVLSDTHVLRPNLVNEFRIGFSRFDLHALPKNMFINAAAAIGIPGINDALPPYSGGLIGVRPTGYMNLGNVTPIPSISQNTNYQLNENLTHIMGRHSMKYGFQVIRRHLNFFESQDPARGLFNFDSTLTNLPSTGAGGNAIASLELGYPAQITRTTLRGVFGLRSWEYSWYAQDDFKVSQRLTLNLGLRYELFPPVTEVEGRIANFNFSRTDPALSLIANVTGDKYVGRTIDPYNFAPRIGFAYGLTDTGRTVVRGSYGLHYVSVHYAGQGAIGRNPPFMPTQAFVPGSLFVGRNVADGLPIPQPVALDTAAKLNAAGGSIFAIQLETHTPRAQQYGFDIEHQLGSGLLLDVGYVGTHGSHLFSTYNLNLATPGPTPLTARRPIQLLNNLPTIGYYGFYGDSNYQGLQAKLSKRFSGGLEFLAVYTWAKSLDNAIAGSSGQRGRPSVSTQYQDINNIGSARGLSSFDLANRFVFSGFYELPFGRGKHFGSGASRAMNTVIGGWQLNTIITLQGGPPFTPALAANGLNNGNFQLPNRIGNGALPDNQRTVQRWFNTSIDPNDSSRAFSNPGPYVFGNSGYNILRGPGLQTVDFAIHKNIPITDRVKLQIRGEGFNIFNQANFALPNFNLGIAASGSIATTITSSRQIQMVAKV
ncbi:MAG TPA: TonB-dependent receptor, partial [Candidatus Solibacter sp.]|nr:TonB-dependent receptor [Candidatus Solibacter sp.]